MKLACCGIQEPVVAVDWETTTWYVRMNSKLVCFVLMSFLTMRQMTRRVVVLGVVVVDVVVAGVGIDVSYLLFDEH